MNAIRGKKKGVSGERFFLSHAATVIVDEGGARKTLSQKLGEMDNGTKYVTSLPTASADTMNKTFVVYGQDGTVTGEYITERVAANVISQGGIGLASELGDYSSSTRWSTNDVVILDENFGEGDAYDICVSEPGPEGGSYEWSGESADRGDAVVIYTGNHRGHIYIWNDEAGWIDGGVYSAGTTYYVYHWKQVNLTGAFAQNHYTKTETEDLIDEKIEELEDYATDEDIASLFAK